MIINLSSTIKVGVSPFSKFTFSAGEEHIRLFDSSNKLEEDKFKSAKDFLIISSIDSASGIMQLLLTHNAIKNINKSANISLYLPYYPFARQDRIMVSGEPASLKVFANLLNECKFYAVHVLDPHSEVTSALTNNISIISNEQFFHYAYSDILAITSNDKSKIVLVSPDAGAEKKIYSTAKILSIENIVLAVKKRNVLTGSIEMTNFIGNVENKICIIQDDIIDGGATFIELAKKLKERGASLVYLIVSHGIFSRGFDCLKSTLDGIYTTNSIKYFPSEYPYVKTYLLDNDIKKMFCE
jgi:ribose-phosphate pyrophosphokinase